MKLLENVSKKDLVVSTAAFVIAIRTAEVAAGIVAGRPNSGPGRDEWLIEHDTLLGWRKIPGASARTVSDEWGEVLESINSAGRPSTVSPATSGIHRVMIGSSRDYATHTASIA